MSQSPQYTQHHPKWYRHHIPIFWWVHKWVHIRFILREITSVFVAFYALVLLFHFRAITQGPEAYANFLTWLGTPGAIVLHGVAFVFLIFHSVTWFNLAPKAMVFHVGSTRIPDMVIIISNYAGWVVFSAAIAWILLTA
ncbi:MAG: fumarate reductase subunit C [Gemmatimonadota bacterium]|nr:fumarate reductase subunit C [Gemmatimonadota bacterium]